MPIASPSPTHRSFVSAIAAIALAACATPAGAAQFAGAADDPANGALPGGRDVVRSEAAYDDGAGALTLRVTFREAPTGSDVLAAGFGHRSPSGACQFPGGVFAGATGGDYATVEWRRFDAAGTRVAEGSDGVRSQAGAVVTYAVAAAGFVAQGYDCLASISVADGGTTVESVPGYALAPVSAPPAPDPVTPSTPAPAPAPAPAAPPAQSRAPAVEKAARLTAAVVGAGSRTLARGRWTKVRLTVANAGTAPARETRVTVGGSRGVAVRLDGAVHRRPGVRALRTLKAGRAATVSVRVRATRNGTLSLRATAAGRLSARATVAIRLKPRRAATPRRPATRAPARRPAARHPLAGRYFWGPRNDPMYAWDNYAVWFLDGRWAWYGFPPAGRPSCTAPTETTDERGRPTGEGCRPFTYDPGTGALRVGDLTGTYRAGGTVVELKEISMNEVAIPRAGARYEVDLLNRGFSGLCGLITGCTTWVDYLKLTADGRFMKGGSTTTTLGDGSATPFVWGSSIPPDRAGTYEILAGGRIRFSYLDGRVVDETIAIERDRSGREDPVEGGVVVGETNYYRESD